MYERQWLGRNNITRLSVADRRLQSSLKKKYYISASDLAEKIYRDTEWGIHLREVIDSAKKNSLNTAFQLNGAGFSCQKTGKSELFCEFCQGLMCFLGCELSVFIFHST